jgi:hypothetical protein
MTRVLLLAALAARRSTLAVARTRETRRTRRFAPLRLPLPAFITSTPASASPWT